MNNSEISEKLASHALDMVDIWRAGAHSPIICNMLEVQRQNNLGSQETLIAMVLYLVNHVEALEALQISRINNAT